MALLAVALALAVFSRSYMGVAEPDAYRTAAVAILAIGLFATHAVPEHLTALLVILLTILLGIAPSEVVLSGFTVGGLWLLFSGLIIGAAVGEAGLGVYVARRLLGRVELTYPKAIVLIVTVAGLMGFLMPATIPRIIILMPVALGLAEGMGFEEGGRGYTGIALAVATGTFFPTFSIMTANLPAIVHVGAIETLYGGAPSYTSFLLYHAPTGILRALGLMALIVFWFREPMPPVRGDFASAPMTAHQRRLLLVLSGALLLWMTDFLHGIGPAWIALAAAIVILWPASRLISPGAFREKIDLSPVLYVAGILGLGATLRHAGLDQKLGTLLVESFGLVQGHDFINFSATFVMSILMCLVLTAVAVPVLLVPLARQIADATGLDLMAVLMTQFFGFTTVIFPYQGPPLVVALGLSRIGAADLIKVCAALALLMLVIGVPLNYLWWKLIGLLG